MRATFENPRNILLHGEFVNVKPSTIIMLLEEIRDDAVNIKTIGEFQRYVGSNFGKFKFEPLKGYE